MWRSPDAAHEVGFWLRHARLGVGISVVVIAAGLVYVAWSPDHPNRAGLLWVLGAAGACTLLVALLPLRRILSHPRGLLAFYLWSAAVLALILALSLADGGASSAFTMILVLPLIFAGSAYPPVAVGFVGAGALGVLALAIAADPQAAPRTIVLQTTVLVAVTAMAAFTARSHWRMYHEQRRLSEQLDHLARHDELTGCLNRRAFQELLHEETARARRYVRPLSLLLIDLDRFKGVNDDHGHRVGDDLLAHVGATLRGITRLGDVAARIGGDEFALLLPEADRPEAQAAAERLCAQLRSGGDLPPATVSIGLTTLPADTGDADGLYDVADRRLYEAKRGGGDRVGAAGHS